MKDPVLVIMAAGMGSRYGGLKQIDPVDEEGNLIIDFSIYDARKAGFRKLIFIIKRELEADFKKMIGDRIAGQIDVEYVYQEQNQLPEGYQVPEGRVKPWGTGHAILCCREYLQGPFAVINADDYYGVQAFPMIYNELIASPEKEDDSYSMVGYSLMNTLTEHGHVARGVCSLDQSNMLREIHERTRIEKKGEQAFYTEDGGIHWEALSKECVVSMNLWGFQTSIFKALDDKFRIFLDEEAKINPEKAEYFLPNVVGELIKEKRATVKVLPTKDKWYGVTYKEDKVMVMKAIEEFKEKGIYPKKLWEV
ncbi:MAG: dTDP-glucose pyrophosphorylase [Herbinix sp.]|jgi:dTDP-glucose pyrophosphorylase|nr:dTDP-glucose pyrophosphorylase [Herbinix sp.]